MSIYALILTVNQHGWNQTQVFQHKEAMYTCSIIDCVSQLIIFLLSSLNVKLL